HFVSPMPAGLPRIYPCPAGPPNAQILLRVLDSSMEELYIYVRLPMRPARSSPVCEASRKPRCQDPEIGWRLRSVVRICVHGLFGRKHHFVAGAGDDPGIDVLSLTLRA